MISSLKPITVTEKSCIMFKSKSAKEIQQLNNQLYSLNNKIDSVNRILDKYEE